MVVLGKHSLVKAVAVVANCKLPLEEAFTLVKVWSYSRNGKGMAIALTKSSQLEPGTSVVAGTTVAPVDDVIV